MYMITRTRDYQIFCKIDDLINYNKNYFIMHQGFMFSEAKNFMCVDSGNNSYLDERIKNDFLANKGFINKRFDERAADLSKKEIKKEKLGKSDDEVYHEKFDEILMLVEANIPVYLAGPAGTGKNVICTQVADALGLEFYFTNAVTQEYKLTGFIDANGKYQETQFYNAFKNGGLFFLDEMDGSIPEVLIILNAALANGYFDFPNGKIKAHKNFRVIAAGNTFGTGATMEYTGRYQLDSASMDRFAVIEVYYSPKIERAMAENDEELLDFIRSFRRYNEENGINCIVSYRSINRIKKLEGKLAMSEILKISLLKGLPLDDVLMIQKNLDAQNRFVQAMAKAPKEEVFEEEYYNDVDDEYYNSIQNDDLRDLVRKRRMV